MAGRTYAGINNIARQPKKIYAGVNNVAREVKAAYVGDPNGIARKVFPMSQIPYDGYTEVEYCYAPIFIDNFSYPFPRVVVVFSVDNKTNNNHYYSSVEELVYLYIARQDSNYQYSYRFVMRYSKIPSDGYAEQGESYGYPSSDGIDYIDHREGVGGSSEGILADKKYTLDMFNNGRVYLTCEDGYFRNTRDITNFEYTSHWSKFSNNLNSAIMRIRYYYDYGFSTRIYSVVASKGSTYLRKWVPCYRNSDKRIGYFDLVEGYFEPSKYNANDWPDGVGPIV